MISISLPSGLRGRFKANPQTVWNEIVSMPKLQSLIFSFRPRIIILSQIRGDWCVDPANKNWRLEMSTDWNTDFSLDMTDWSLYAKQEARLLFRRDWKSIINRRIIQLNLCLVLKNLSKLRANTGKQSQRLAFIGKKMR